MDIIDNICNIGKAWIHLCIVHWYTKSLQFILMNDSLNNYTHAENKFVMSSIAREDLQRFT